MMRVNRQLILECLEELARRDIQEKLWLAAGATETSSFIEVVAQLFSDSGLDDALPRKQTRLGQNAEALLLELEKALDAIDGSRRPSEIIDDPAMVKVRELASAALAAIGEE